MSLRFRRSIRIAAGRSRQPRLRRRRAECRAAGASSRVEPPRHVHQRRIPSHGNLCGPPRARLTGRASAWLPRGSLLLVVVSDDSTAVYACPHEF